MVQRLGLVLLAVMLAGWSFGIARAQNNQEYAPPPELQQAQDSKQGWVLSLKLGASLSFMDNRKVVGQPNGSSFTFGGTVDFGADYYQGNHELRNIVALAETVTRTPTIRDFVKTNDSFKLESTYLYYLISWFGFYGHVSFDTPIFRGYDYRASTTTYEITYRNGTTRTRTGRKLLLTEYFSPITLKEDIGPFARPVKSDPANIEIRLGFGGRHAFAKGNLVIQDSAATPNLDVLELANIHQGGISFVFAFWGEAADKRVSYRVGFEAMMPLIYKLARGDHRNPAQLTNLEFGAKLSFKLVEWASLDYELKAFRQPQVIRDFQVQNNLLLTFSYSLL